jgi:ATP-dependent DNA helicase RecG
MSAVDRYAILAEEYARGGTELPHVEFKINNWQPDNIGTLISAISNVARLLDEPCGYVIWGVDDVRHEVVGTTFKPVAEKANGQPLELWLANSKVLNAAITLDKDKPNSVFHPGGTAIVIHAGKDDCTSDPAGNAGGRIVCGVIGE